MNNELFFKSDGTFKILQFTDIHYSEGNDIDYRTTELMSRLIKMEEPDFIITTGDTVYGKDNAVLLKKALSPIIEAGVPWSYTFGNHDTEDGKDYDILFSIITSLPNCVLYNADDTVDGWGNHFLELKNNREETKWILFGIDSGNYNGITHIGGYDYVKPSQINWYKKSISDLEVKYNEFSSLVFMHIPLPEYNQVWDMGKCRGQKKEGICCPEINSGFFAAMQEVGHTKGVFVGHDHINDFIGDLYGVALAYGRATGYNTYSQEGYLKGARIILLEENNLKSFESYIRLEDESIIED